MRERTEKVRYYSYLDGLSVLRAIGIDYAYLDKGSGKWVPDNSLIGPITGHDGSADCHEISLAQAQRWVADNRPVLNVEWL